MEDEKDTFQDIVLQLWKSVDTFKGASNISTWIYRVSLNTILSNRRKTERNISTTTIEAATTQATPTDDNLELLKLILSSLSGVDKALLILHLDGYKHQEIGEILEISHSSVSTRFNRIKTQLKAKFGHTDYEIR